MPRRSGGRTGLALALALLCVTLPLAAQPRFEVELGGVFSGYNDVRIPGDTGTQFSLSEELETDPGLAVRLRTLFTWGGRHTLILLAAPLELQADGALDRELRFAGASFPKNTPLTATYRFDSYRLTYRYAFVRQPHLRAAAGLTAKIRDAAIRVEGGGLKAEKTNTGFVPLLHVLGEWDFAPQWALVLEGDALAAPQGRAEDMLLAVQWGRAPHVTLRAGYRVLEGGADNDEVYNFTLLHYAVMAISIRL